MKTKTALLDGFSKLNHQERLAVLTAAGFLTSNDTQLINSSQALSISLAEKFIENAISYFQLPLGVAINFKIDNKDFIIPMAVEETSIIAAASKNAKWIKQQGHIQTKTLSTLAIGQIQLAKIKQFAPFQQTINANKKNLIQLANEKVAANLVKRGGGVKDILVRGIWRDDNYTMGIIHVMVETCDAMGANIINQICEFLKTPIEQLTKEKVNICILTNLVDSKLTQATVTIKNIDKELGEAIEEASLFAYLDPYRAATNNKGILNAIDAVAIATGNDWRAVEAGIHAYAAHSGQYRSISQWKLINNDLVGTLVAPINVGIVGGVTQLHPMAKICLNLLNINSANDLARIMAAVGLVQNLGALRALTTEGITKGHMRLHLSNLCLSAGAYEHEVPALKQELEKFLMTHKKVTMSDAAHLLTGLRANHKEMNNDSQYKRA